ncbi:hypothetical protein ACHAWF_009465, partial [Thalassiosira exigua]
MAYSQAPIECDLVYTELIHGISVKGVSAKDYALNFLANVYGQKQGGLVWNNYLMSKLVNELGFNKSKLEHCVFYRRSMIFICFTDDGIALDIDSENTDNFVQEFVDSKLKVEDMGNPNDYVDVNIRRQSDG